MPTPTLPAADRLTGVALILLSAGSFGVLPIFTRLAYADGANTLAVLCLRFGLAAAMMVVLMRLRGDTWPRGKVLGGLVLMGSIGYVGQSLCYFAALNYAPAGVVALLLYLFPILVTIMAAIWLKQPLTPRKLVALVIACFGLVLTIGPALGGKPLGIALGMGAALIYSVYIVVGSRITPRAGAFPASTVIMLAAAGVFGAAAAAGSPSWPHSAAGWAAIAGLALLSTVVAIVSFFAALSRLGAADASTLSTFEPVVSVVLASWILGESMGPGQWLGGAAILSAAVLLARAPAVRPLDTSSPV